MKPLLSIVLFFSFCLGALGMAMGLNLPQALQQADVIARIKILDSPESAPATGQPSPTKTNAYQRLARAEILDSAKGMKAGSIILIEHDNGFACPNIIYSKGDDCIVFARKLKNGHYETMNTYAGCFRIEKGVVADFYLFSEQPQLATNAKPEDILSELRRLLKKPQPL